MAACVDAADTLLRPMACRHGERLLNLGARWQLNRLTVNSILATTINAPEETIRFFWRTLAQSS